MQGTWVYQSFLMLSSETEWAAPPGTSVSARKWAKGTLAILNSTDDEFSGELVFTETVKLNVKGKILPATNGAPAVLDAIAEGIEGLANGAIYKISGWINPTSSDQAEPTDVRGHCRWCG